MTLKKVLYTPSTTLTFQVTFHDMCCIFFFFCLFCLFLLKAGSSVQKWFLSEAKDCQVLKYRYSVGVFNSLWLMRRIMSMALSLQRLRTHWRYNGGNRLFVLSPFRFFRYDYFAVFCDQLPCVSHYQSILRQKKKRKKKTCWKVWKFTYRLNLVL